MIDLHAAQVDAGDQVITADGISEKGICLAQRHCRERGQGGAIQLQFCLRVEGTHQGLGQIVIDHGQAQVFERVVAAQGVPSSGDNHRLIVGVRVAEHQLCVCSFEGIGTAQHIDLPGMQGSNGLSPVGKTPHLDRDAQ
ncbi:hypothetical protein D3C77_408130 [compost metagenome]